MRSSAVRMLCVCQNIHALPLLVYTCRAVLLIAFKNGAMPVMCKFTAEQQAVVHEFEILELLWQEPAVPRIVGPVKLLKANPAGRSHGHVAAPGGQSTMYRHSCMSVITKSWVDAPLSMHITNRPNLLLSAVLCSC